MGFLVDTDIVTELAKPTPNSGVLGWADTVKTIEVSAVTLEEIHYGLTLKPDPRIATWLDAFLADFCRIRLVSQEVAIRAAQLRSELHSRGTTRTQADMLIAATASVHGSTLVTRNVSQFDGCGIAVLNPFE